MSNYNEFDRDIERMDDEWHIIDDQTAEWAIRKIAEARAEYEEWAAFYMDKLEAVHKSKQNTIDYMEGRLLEYFNTQKRKITKTGIEKYSLPSGELIRKPAGIDYQRNEEAMLEWCEKHLPEAIKVTRKVCWAEVKAHMQATGEIPDGVTPFETAPTFTVKEAKTK